MRGGGAASPSPPARAGEDGSHVSLNFNALGTCGTLHTTPRRAGSTAVYECHSRAFSRRFLDQNTDLSLIGIAALCFKSLRFVSSTPVHLRTTRASAVEESSSTGSSAASSIRPLSRGTVTVGPDRWSTCPVPKAVAHSGCLRRHGFSVRSDRRPLAIAMMATRVLVVNSPVVPLGSGLPPLSRKRTLAMCLGDPGFDRGRGGDHFARPFEPSIAIPCGRWRDDRWARISATTAGASFSRRSTGEVKSTGDVTTRRRPVDCDRRRFMIFRAVTFGRPDREIGSAERDIHGPT